MFKNEFVDLFKSSYFIPYHNFVFLLFDWETIFYFLVSFLSFSVSVLMFKSKTMSPIKKCCTENCRYFLGKQLLFSGGAANTGEIYENRFLNAV